jgi:hypothetical protein
MSTVLPNWARVPRDGGKSKPHTSAKKQRRELSGVAPPRYINNSRLTAPPSRAGGQLAMARS